MKSSLENVARPRISGRPDFHNEQLFANHNQTNYLTRNDAKNLAYLTILTILPKLRHYVLPSLQINLARNLYERERSYKFPLLHKPVTQVKQKVVICLFRKMVSAEGKRKQYANGNSIPLALC